MTKVIKRYKNRKLYDTQVGAYIDFEQLRELVYSHIDFKVVCHTTKNDITGTTLCQMMLEKEKSTPFKLDIEILKQIVCAGSIAIYFYVRGAKAEVEANKAA